MDQGSEVEERITMVEEITTSDIINDGNVIRESSTKVSTHILRHFQYDDGRTMQADNSLGFDIFEDSEDSIVEGGNLMEYDITSEEDKENETPNLNFRGNVIEETIFTKYTEKQEDLM